MTQSELGLKAFGKVDNTAIQSLRKGSMPGYDRVAAMADVLGLQLYLGRPIANVTGFSESASETDLGKVEALRSGYLPIPWHDMARRPGSSPVAFSREWMEAHALLPDNLRAVMPDIVHVASMTAAKTVVVVDGSSHRLRQNGLNAFKRGTEVHLAYVTFARDLAVITSPAPTLGSTIVFPDDEVPLRALGQVVWSGQVWR